jgi:hypothetical protein
MSATSKPTVDERHAQRAKDANRTPPEDVFGEHIESNHAICSRCFARQRQLALIAVPVRTDETNGDLLGITKAEEAETGDEQVLYEAWESTEDLEVDYPPRVRTASRDQCDVYVPASWARACPDATTYCGACGAVDDDGSRSTLSKEELLRYAGNVSDRLREQGIEHDREWLLVIGKQLKSREGVQAKDDLILRHATRTAVEQARFGRAREMKIDTSRSEIAVRDAADVAWMRAH